MKAITETDFRPLCRDSDIVDTRVSLVSDYANIPWFRCGQIKLVRPTDRHRNIWTLSAYLDNAVDFEHSSAHVFSIELIAVDLDLIAYGILRLEGWIHGDHPDGFRFPSSLYDPRTHPKAKLCKDSSCLRETKHLIIPEDYYVPKANTVLYDIVRGKQIVIRTGRAVPKTED